MSLEMTKCVSKTFQISGENHLQNSEIILQGLWVPEVFNGNETETGSPIKGLVKRKNTPPGQN